MRVLGPSKAAARLAKPSAEKRLAVKPDAGRKAAVHRPKGFAVFGSVPIRMRGLEPLKRMTPIYAETGATAGCPGLLCEAVKDLPRKTELKDAREVLALLNTVNRMVNSRIAYTPDRILRNAADHWSAPTETLAAGKGDCEDYAILKLGVLQALGFAPQDMSLVVLLDEQRSLFHAVLAVRTAGRFYILDNLSERVVTDHEMPSYLPLYSITDGEGFIHGRKAAKPARMAQFSPSNLTTITPGEGIAKTGR